MFRKFEISTPNSPYALGYRKARSAEQAKLAFALDMLADVSTDEDEPSSSRVPCGDGLECDMDVRAARLAAQLEATPVPARKEGN